MLAYWLGIMCIAMAINFFNLVAPKMLFAFNSSLVVKFRQAFTMPALFGFKHSIPISYFKVISMATPSRAQGMVILGYIIMNIVLTMVKYDVFEPNPWFPDKGEQLGRYIADRTGLLATSQFPAIFLFAGRNNLLLWLTGWSFDTFNVYHRWIARMMVLHAFIHSVCYTWLERSYLAECWEDTYWRWGVIATIMGFFLLGHSIHFLRTRGYEVFLFFHIVFAVFFVIGMWYHLVELGWMNWMYGTIAVWAFDRLVRILRLFWSGLGTAQTQLHSDGVFLMTIDYSKRWKFYPGCYVYVHVMRKWGFWESHPFTLYQSPLPENEGKLMLAATVKKGMTRRIAEDLASTPNGTKAFKILIDGPYGHSPNIGKYDTAVFVCGGIGITSGLGQIRDILINKYHEQHIIFIWVLRHKSMLQCFLKEIQFLSDSDKCDIQIFITNSQPGEDDSSVNNGSTSELSDGDSTEKKDGNGSTHQLVTGSRCNVVTGFRPDINTLIPEYIKQSTGTTGILCCGPPTLNDTTRRCVTDNLGNGKGRVDYFEEAFSW